MTDPVQQPRPREDPAPPMSRIKEEAEHREAYSARISDAILYSPRERATRQRPATR